VSYIVQAVYPPFPALPAPVSRVLPRAATSSTTAIAYAVSQDIISGGAGSWVNPGNADGSPDSTYATWTAP
jgi:hypothetical protein